MFGIESASIKHSVVHFWLLIRQNSTSGERIRCFSRKASTYVSLLHQIQTGKLITDRPANSTEIIQQSCVFSKDRAQKQFPEYLDSE